MSGGKGSNLGSGPVPKRSEERIRENKDVIPVEKIQMNGSVEVPLLGLENPHPLTVEIYNSLKDSGQSKYYEPSDWQFARYTMHFVDQIVKTSKPSAMMLATINQMLSSLLMTEGDRRRVRIEVERQNMQATVFDVAAVFAERAKAGKTGSDG